MKKVMWIFGLPGSGVKTLIDNINSSNDIKEILDINSSNITFLDAINQEDISFYGYELHYQRKQHIINFVDNFMKSNSDLLVIVGQIDDFNDVHDSIIKTTSDIFINLEKEIIFLQPSNLDVLYERLKKSSWFKSYSDNAYRYPRIWLDVAVNHVRRVLQKYEDCGYKIKEIDTTNGYKINQEDCLKLNRINKG